MNQTSLIKHYDARSLPLLKPHLAQWIKVLQKYQSEVEPPWFYRERTQVGFFASASWLIGVPALEEWRLTKDPHERKIQGRCDLWIKTGDYHIEAKHMWCRVTGNIIKEMNYIKKTQLEAEKSAQLVDARNRLAFSFLTPFIQNRKQGDIHKQTTHWLESVLQLKHDAIAWYLPERKRSDFSEDNLQIGLVLLISKV